MTIAPIVRMRSIISEKNCLENSGNDLEYQQLQSDNSSSNSDLDSQSELKPGKARRSTQVKFINFPFFIQFSILYLLDLRTDSSVFTPTMLRNELGLSSHIDATVT